MSDRDSVHAKYYYVNYITHYICIVFQCNRLCLLYMYAIIYYIVDLII